MPNGELLTKTLAHIEAHPAQWHQTAWFHQADYGTAYCFAGWAIVLAGGEFAAAVRAVAPGGDVTNEDHHRDPAALAAELLGIPNHGWCECGVCGDEDMAPLFAPDNDLDDLREIVAAHIAQEQPGA